MRALLIVACMASIASAQPQDAPPCTGTFLPQPSRECTPSPCQERRLRVGRIALEAVMGTALGAVPTVVGGYAGLSIDLANGKEAGAGMDIGLAIGAALGAGTGVYVGGELMHGDGAYGWAVLGSTAGTGLAAGVLAIHDSAATLVFAATLPVAGAIAGYELSSHGRRKPIAVLPAIGRNTIGIAGAF
jgi:hypothetical protein